jgi:hypothetical protein
MIITQNPEGEVYGQLIDLAFDTCDKFSLVVFPFVSPHGAQIIEKLSSSLIEIKKQTEWFGTKYFGDPVAVYYFYVDNKSRQVIKNNAYSLYEWTNLIEPGLPDDLIFYRNGLPWLTTTAHEEQSSIENTTKEDIKRLQKIKGLQFKL